MRNKNGFTIYELIIIIAIILILSSIGTPSFLSWRNNAKIRDAVSSLRVDLEMAKLRAMQENAYVAVLLYAGKYTIFVDDGEGASGVAENWIPDGDEKILQNRSLPTGVSIDLATTTFADNRTRFNGRGYISNQGVVRIVNTAGKQRTVDLNNRFGRISVN